MVGKTKRGKGTKTLVLVDSQGLSLAAIIASVTFHKVTLIESHLEKRLRKRLLYDRATDSDHLGLRLARRRMELITPHRKSRKAPSLHHGRILRRYRHRWKNERSISWLYNFRRLVTRYEYCDHKTHGFVQLACLIIVLKQL